jgi:fumarate reductase flavoprotein subunit
MPAPSWDVEIVVVGSGAAGLSAALTAVEQGAQSVLVAEAEDVVGGSSRLSGGLVMGAGTRFQKALGIDDDADSLYHDYLQLNRWDVESAPVRRLAERSGATVEWLADLGVEYYPTLVFGGEERVPRVHCPVGRGQAIVDVLHRHCREANVDFALGRRVDRLLVEDGVVCGVAVGDDEIRAGAVVLTTGGFGASPEKLAAHYPSAAATEWTWYIGAAGSRGDILDLVDPLGVQLAGHDHGLRLLDCGFDRVYEAYLPGWLVLVNQEGRRFADETAPYGILDYLTRQQGDRAWVIFDQASLDATDATGVAGYKQEIPGSSKKKSPHWNGDIVAQIMAEGRMVSAPDLASLAGALGLPADRLAGTVARYNSGCDAGADADFLKAAKFLQPVAQPPFYGAEVRPATVCSTAYGPRITADAEVRGPGGDPVPGLYAAGECTGGVVGAQYLGSGNNYANCVVMGRVAGESAARRVTSAAVREGVLL